MEAVIFIGCQASGKSTYFQSRFADTHVRINLDMLRTRRREEILFHACLEMKQPFVIDNTNPTRGDRLRYLGPALRAGFSVAGYYFESKIESLLERNRKRPEKDRVPDAGVRGTYGKLELPVMEEGFSSLWYVRTVETGGFLTEEWKV